jgi:hypothetical protein
MNYVLFCFVLFLVIFHSGLDRLQAATIRASSLSFKDVQAAVTAAGNGDVVEIPPGSATWTSTLVVDKAITLRGAGIDQTTISNGQNDINKSVISIRPPPSGLARVTGMTLNGNNAGRGIYVSGSVGRVFRVDHVKFVRCNSRAVYSQGDHYGLVDNCIFLNCVKTVDVYGSGNGTDSWNRRLSLGNTNCVVIEDSHFEYDYDFGASIAATTSSGLGGRRVWRHNTWSNFNANLNFYPIVDAHGNQKSVSGQTFDEEPPGGTGNHRGTRQLEMYNNVFWAVSGSNCRLTDLRGGTMVVFNNSFHGPGMTSSFRVREEDGKNNFLSGYPGYDMHRMWFWANHVNGTLIERANFAYDSDKQFILEGSNLFWSRRSNYTPLEYPHPLRANRTSSPATISFSSESYVAAADAQVISITVRRTVDTSGAVAISYSTADGAAVEGKDYLAATGVLNWEDGDISDKAFEVQLLAKETVENRTFTVQLESPAGGAQLGTPATASVILPGMETNDSLTGVPLMNGLRFRAEDGLVESPYFVSNGVVLQTVETTDPNLGGRARWRVTIPETGFYVVNIRVDASTGSSDSLFINFNGEPTTSQEWHVAPLTSGFEERLVTWADEGAQVFALSAGEHTLIIRGREANCKLETITLVAEMPPAPPTGLRLISNN